MPGSPLTKEELYEVLVQQLPKQNDYAVSDYSEELHELNIFGISTQEALVELIIKHKESLMLIDAEPVDPFLVNYFKQEYGYEEIQIRINNKFWYAYPALLRILLQLEFGDEYVKFANTRDDV